MITRWDWALKENWILNSLPQEEHESLLPMLQPTSLPPGQIIYVPDDYIEYVYFPSRGMVLVSVTEDGATVEIGMVGNEGMIGIPIILGADIMPYQAEVQVEGDALKMRAEALKREFDQGGELQKLLLLYTNVLIAQLAQSALCNRFHTVGERLCRWLLITSDRVKSNEFKLTQDDLSHMMGSHRPNVTVAARVLQNAGLIHYSRGQITIIDRDGLEAAACECYRIVKQKFDQMVEA